MRGLFLLPTVYRFDASELAATKVETSLQLRTMIRSAPTETQSMSENDFECFASTGEKSPASAMLERLASDRTRIQLLSDSPDHSVFAWGLISVTKLSY